MPLTSAFRVWLIVFQAFRFGISQWRFGSLLWVLGRRRRPPVRTTPLSFRAAIGWAGLNFGRSVWSAVWRWASRASTDRPSGSRGFRILSRTGESSRTMNFAKFSSEKSRHSMNLRTLKSLERDFGFFDENNCRFFRGGGGGLHWRINRLLTHDESFIMKHVGQFVLFWALNVEEILIF